MHAAAQRRLGHALQAIRSIQTYTADAPLPECLANDLTCSAVLRQLGIVQEALRVALLEEPCLRQSWPELDSCREMCARMRDWQHPLRVEELKLSSPKRNSARDLSQRGGPAPSA